MDSCIPVVKHTLAALNERFHVSITTNKHVLSCEKESSRQTLSRTRMRRTQGCWWPIARGQEFNNKALTCILRQA